MILAGAKGTLCGKQQKDPGFIVQSTKKPL
jgi:hypothetical protein